VEDGSAFGGGLLSSDVLDLCAYVLERVVRISRSHM
jgi:hypothetical protein